MGKSAIDSKRVLRFTFVKLKVNGQKLAGGMGKKKVGLNFKQKDMISTY